MAGIVCTQTTEGAYPQLTSFIDESTVHLIIWQAGFIIGIISKIAQFPALTIVLPESFSLSTKPKVPFFVLVDIDDYGACLSNTIEPIMFAIEAVQSFHCSNPQLFVRIKKNGIRTHIVKAVWVVCLFIVSQVACSKVHYQDAISISAYPKLVIVINTKGVHI